jgi:CheY-like chemotaxis protein
MEKKRILVINDTEEVLELFRLLVEGELGGEMVAMTYRPHVMEEIRHIDPDLIVCDYIFGGEAVGWQLVQKLRMDRATEHTPVIICSGAVKELRDLEGILAEKNIDILIKPFDIDDFLSVARKKLAQGEENHGNSKKR